MFVTCNLQVVPPIICLTWLAHYCNLCKWIWIYPSGSCNNILWENNLNWYGVLAILMKLDYGVSEASRSLTCLEVLSGKSSRCLFVGISLDSSQIWSADDDSSSMLGDFATVGFSEMALQFQAKNKGKLSGPKKNNLTKGSPSASFWNAVGLKYGCASQWGSTLIPVMGSIVIKFFSGMPSSAFASRWVTRQAKEN